MAFTQRWLAWEVIVNNYLLDTYSISDTIASHILQLKIHRRSLLAYYIKTMIYYAIKSDRLETWLESEAVITLVKEQRENEHFVDGNYVFTNNFDVDFDNVRHGVTRSRFCEYYHSWIEYCVDKRASETGTPRLNSSRNSPVTIFCFALSLLGRRLLYAFRHRTSVHFFLYGIHALFKGDFRIVNQKDEWIFCDTDILRKVVSPAVKVALKLLQDQVGLLEDEITECDRLYTEISEITDQWVIAFEGDPAWRSAVLSNAAHLLSLRQVVDDAHDQHYKIIMLNRKLQAFKIIKVNRECVRGLWAGQQQELIFLRNPNPERGSIQNAKQALRNMINSSCDQPIGYPIYVSPLITSYSGSHKHLSAVVGGEFGFRRIGNILRNCWHRLRLHCGATCTGASFSEDIPQSSCVGSYRSRHMSGSGDPVGGGGGGPTPGSRASFGLNTGKRAMITQQSFRSGSPVLPHRSLSTGTGGVGGAAGDASSHSLHLQTPPTNLLSSAATASFEMAATGALATSGSSDGTAAGVPPRAIFNLSVPSPLRSSLNLGSSSSQDNHLLFSKVRIKNISHIYENLNQTKRLHVQFVSSEHRAKGGISGWNGWYPQKGMEGQIMHVWWPRHPNQFFRSHVDKTICLVKIDDYYLPIEEAGIEVISNSKTNQQQHSRSLTVTNTSSGTGTGPGANNGGTVATTNSAAAGADDTTKTNGGSPSSGSLVREVAV